ncbi:hypothetical protein ACE6H2_020846 [Prunus campanulata]
MGSDSLSVQAAIMSESLRKSQTITNSVVSILSSFDHYLSALETSMRPTQAQKSAWERPASQIPVSLKGKFGSNND